MPTTDHDDTITSAIVNADEPVTVEDFDIDAFVSGMQPTVRAVKLYGRADLLAAIDEAERALQLAQADAQPSERTMADAPAGDIEALEQRLEDLQGQFIASGRWFRVRGRTDAWRDHRSKVLKKAGLSDNDIALALVAESIVQPSGVKLEHLQAMQEANEPQVKLLIVAWQMACQKPAAVTAPFSRSSSNAPQG